MSRLTNYLAAAVQLYGFIHRYLVADRLARPTKNLSDNYEEYGFFWSVSALQLIAIERGAKFWKTHINSKRC